MCFGNTETTKKDETTQTRSLPSWVTNAAQSNLNFAQGLQNTGFQPYTGQQVANFSPQQQQSFGLGSDLAAGVQPYVGNAGSWINNYANAGPQSVQADTIASRMSPYMSQYVMQALAPQLEAQNQQFAGQNKAWDANATMAGAFGDTSWGLGKTNLTNQQDIARSGLIGNAYQNAFNTAIGAGAQDVANNLNAQTTNANFGETALGRQLSGANALYGQGTGATNLLNTLGGQQTQQQQANLNALYNQWQLAQQYPYQNLQAMNSALGAAAGASPITTTGTTTSSAPNNSGWGMLGTIGGTALGALVGGPMGASIGGSLGGAAGNWLGGSGSMGGSGAVMPNTNQQGWNPNVAGGYNYGGGYADGGNIPAGRPALVGERGPEIIVPGANGLVIPNEILEAALEKRAKKTGKKSDKKSPASGIAAQLGLAA